MSADFEVKLVGNTEKVAKKSAAAVDRLAKALEHVDVSSKKGKKSLSEFNRVSSLSTRSINNQARALRAVTSLKSAKIRADKLESRQMKKARGGSGYGGVSKALGGIAVAYGAISAARRAGGAVLDFGGAAVDMFKFGENTRLAFTRLTGGATAGAAAFQRARDLADELSVKVTETAPQLKQLLAQQFTLERSTELVKLGADLKVLGNTADDVSGALRAISQIKAKGKLQQEELLQLAERGISLKLVRDELKKTYGVNDKELEKLQRKGGIGGDAAIDAIQRAILKKVGSAKAGDAGKAFAKETLSGALAAFGNRKANFMLDIVDKARGAFKGLGPTVSSLADVFTDSDRIDRFAGAFSTIGDTMKRMGPSLVTGFATGMDFLAGSFERITTLGGAFFESFIGGLSTSFPALKDFFAGPTDKRMIELFETVGTVTGRVAGQFVEIASVVSSVTTKITGAWNWMADFLQLKTFGLGDWLTGFFPSIGIRIVDGLIAGITGQSGFLMEKIKSLGSAMVTAMKSAVGIASPSKEFMKLGDFMQLGVAKGLTANDNAIRASAGLGLSTAAAFQAPTMAAPKSNYSKSPAAAMSGGGGSTTNNNMIDVNNNFDVSTDVEGSGLEAEASAGVSLGLGAALRMFAA